jgi:hypothetical protein
MRSLCYLCACVPHFKFLNHNTDSYEMNYELYVTEAYAKNVLVHALRSAITIWWTHELVRRDTYGPAVMDSTCEIC